MFATFSSVPDSSMLIYIFSRIYLYTFIALFIYVILSIFIAIIMVGHNFDIKLRLFVNFFISAGRIRHHQRVPEGQIVAQVQDQGLLQQGDSSSSR